MNKIILKDKSVREFENNTSLVEIAKSISPSFFKKCLCARLNSKPYSLFECISDYEGEIEFILNDSSEAFEILNHSCSHLLAQAVKRLYNNVSLYVGPAIEEGFYYDFDLKTSISIEDLPKIEEEMKKIVKENLKILRKDISKVEALELFKDDILKTDLINNIEGDYVSLYSQGEFFDICRGPHVLSTSLLKNFKLLATSGAYFKGDSKNQMLTRIYGVCFLNESDLQSHLNILEERRKRDHRKLGKELNLFMLSEYGPGFPFWLPNGMILKKCLENFWYDVHIKAGYKLIQTPILLNKELWETSGHWFNYKENMYLSNIDDYEFAIKPMNCPGGILVYKNDIHSYREFPLRLAELGLVHRHEASGALQGLFRVRSFTQDDAHIFLTIDQIRDEISEVILLYKKVYEIFNLSFHIELSTRPEEKYIGEISTWDESEKALAEACKKAGFDFVVNEGDGAFYGPKLDFKLRDSMRRIWQCGTIQLDMNLPKRFGLSYIDQFGNKKEPVMVHRALFGSFERFIGILIEHYGGAFPVWCSPVQVRVIPVNMNYHLDYSNRIYNLLKDNDIRVDYDYKEEKLSYKIREAQTTKIPYSIILGDNEMNNNLISYRKYGDIKTYTLEIDEFINLIKEHNKNYNWYCKKLYENQL